MPSRSQMTCNPTRSSPADGGPLKLVGNPVEMLTAAGGGNVVAAVGQGGCGGVQPAEFGVLLDGSIIYVAKLMRR